jgi:hypothetical protein
MGTHNSSTLLPLPDSREVGWSRRTHSFCVENRAAGFLSRCILSRKGEGRGDRVEALVFLPSNCFHLPPEVRRRIAISLKVQKDFNVSCTFFPRERAPAGEERVSPRSRRLISAVGRGEGSLLNCLSLSLFIRIRDKKTTS